MDVERVDDSQDDLQIVAFKRTPIMSTYLVAFIVGEFDYVEDRTVDGVLVRVYTPVGKREQGRFALEVSTKCYFSPTFSHSLCRKLIILYLYLKMFLKHFKKYSNDEKSL